MFFVETSFDVQGNRGALIGCEGIDEDSSLSFPEKAGSGTVAALTPGAFTKEAAFADKALEERGDAVGREGPFKGEADILMGDGVALGEEGGEALVDVIGISVEGLAEWRLIDLEVLDFGEQFRVGLEVDVADVDVATVVIAVLYLNLAFDGEAEGADAWQRDGVALLHLVKHDALQVAQCVLQFACGQGGIQTEAAALKVNGIDGRSLLQPWLQTNLAFLGGRGCPLCNCESDGHLCDLLIGLTLQR